MAGSSFSGGSFTAATSVDTNQGVRSVAGNLDNATNPTGMTVTFPSTAYSGMSIFNRSTDANNYLRVTVDFVPGAVVAPGDNVHLVPPGGVASISFDSDVIDGFTVQAVTPPLPGTVVDASLLTPGIVGTVPFIVNVVNG